MASIIMTSNIPPPLLGVPLLHASLPCAVEAVIFDHLSHRGTALLRNLCHGATLAMHYYWQHHAHHVVIDSPNMKTSAFLAQLGRYDRVRTLHMEPIQWKLDLVMLAALFKRNASSLVRFTGHGLHHDRSFVLSHMKRCDQLTSLTLSLHGASDARVAADITDVVAACPLLTSLSLTDEIIPNAIFKLGTHIISIYHHPASPLLAHTTLLYRSSLASSAPVFGSIITGSHLVVPQSLVNLAGRVSTHRADWHCVQTIRQLGIIGYVSSVVAACSDIATSEDTAWWYDMG